MKQLRNINCCKSPSPQDELPWMWSKGRYCSHFTALLPVNVCWSFWELISCLPLLQTLTVSRLYTEVYGNSIWSKGRNKRAYFPLSGEESSKPLGHIVETTVRTVKSFLELKDQEESKKQEENELLNRVYLRRALINSDAWCRSLSRHSSAH